MGRAAICTEFQRGMIIRLRKEGKACREIASLAVIKIRFAMQLNIFKRIVLCVASNQVLDYYMIESSQTFPKKSIKNR